MTIVWIIKYKYTIFSNNMYVENSFAPVYFQTPGQLSSNMKKIIKPDRCCLHKYSNPVLWNLHGYTNDKLITNHMKGTVIRP